MEKTSYDKEFDGGRTRDVCLYFRLPRFIQYFVILNIFKYLDLYCILINKICAGKSPDIVEGLKTGYLFNEIIEGSAM